MKNADRRVYVAFLTGVGDDVVLTNAKRLMAKRNVKETELHEVKVEKDLPKRGERPGPGGSPWPVWSRRPLASQANDGRPMPHARPSNE
jgi:hypothetical protein